MSVTVSQQLRQKTYEQCIGYSIGYNILIKLLELTPESESQNIDFCVLLQVTTTKIIVVLLLK